MKNFIKYGTILYFVLCIQQHVFAQKNNKNENEFAINKQDIMISVGYAIPSSIRYVLKSENTHDELKISGQGPFIFKAEYMINKRWSVLLNGTLNFIRLKWMSEGYDTIINKTKDFEGGVYGNEITGTLRSNYYFSNKTNGSFYAGFGLGYSNAHLTYYNLSHVGYFKESYELPRINLEATLGYKYFPIKRIGFFAELGIGKTIITHKGIGNSFYFLSLNKYVYPDALLQAGITLKL